MYTAKNFDHLLGTPGFSDTLLKNHFTLYEGYVKNCNILHEKFGELQKNNLLGSIEAAELRRRAAWEHNGMRLHELYFGNMKNGVGELQNNSTLSQQIIKQYGSYEMWEKDFKASGAMRGIGWVIFMQDNETNILRNSWINEHDVGLCVGMTPLLIMDVFEHAYITDYGLKRVDYIQNFMNAIDWNVVNQRFEANTSNHET